MKAKVNLKDVVVSYKESFVGKREKEAVITNEEIEVAVTLSHIEDARDYVGQEGALVIEEDNNVILLSETALSEHVRATIDEKKVEV